MTIPTLYVFRAPGARTLHGLGTLDQAQAYADHLNEGHGSKAYVVDAVGPDATANVPKTDLAIVDLADALATIDLEGGVD